MGNTKPDLFVAPTGREQSAIGFYIEECSIRKSLYGADKIVTFVGKAGTGFAEDTYCIHQGTPPTQRDRLILQLQFAINDYGVQSDIKDPAIMENLASRE